ncbi:MAG: LysM peptidoglycan-binding domain-containing protein, partial [Caldilineaceae bacterium]
MAIVHAQPSLAESTVSAAAGVAGDVPAALQSMQTRMQQTLSDQVTPVRLASHLSVLLVAAAVLLFSRVDIPEWDFQLVAMPTAQPATAGFNSVTTRMAELLSNPAGVVPIADELQPQIVPFTIIPERTRQVVQIYTVAAGDTVLGIAQKFGLQPETLQWSNPDLENNPDLLSIGDQVKILPLDGVLHTVRAG